MSRLYCRMFGHKWHPVHPRTKASVLLICIRCRENGWEI